MKDLKNEDDEEKIPPLIRLKMYVVFILIFFMVIFFWHIKNKYIHL